MTGRRAAQRAAELVVLLACRLLPADVRHDRRREWTAELDAAWHDPDVPFAPLRAVRALRYAAGVVWAACRLGRAARRATGRARRAAPNPAVRVAAGLGIWLGLVVLAVTLVRAFQPHGLWPLAPGLAAAAGFAAFCLIDLARAGSARYLPRWCWAIACLASIPLGGIMYLSVGRVRRGEAAGE